MTSKGQVTLPKALREELRLKKGDRVSFERVRDGWLLRRKAAGGRNSDGAAVPFIRHPAALSIDEMKRVAKQRAAAHYFGGDKP